MSEWLFREFSDETDDYGEDDVLPPGGSDAVLYTSDWTVETILQQFKRGSIKLQPRFQRRDAWSIEKKSAYIESILLNLPVPQIVLAESKSTRGEFIVLDGKQRLLALIQFAGLGEGKNNCFRLTGLQFLRKLNRLTFSELENDPDQIGQFLTYTVRSVIIRNWPTEDFLDIVFVRLNQNSVKLSPQELRAALFPGPFTDAVDDFTWRSTSLRRLLNLRPDEVDFRMRDMELVVRYIGFGHFLPSYRGNLKRFLDYVCRENNGMWDALNATVSADLQLFETSLSILLDVFADSGVARKWDAKAGRFRGPINRAILDCHLFYLRNGDVRDFYVSEPQKIVELAIRVGEDPEYVKAVETTTKSIPNVVDRLRIWGKALEHAGVNEHLPVPLIGNTGVITLV